MSADYMLILERRLVSIRRLRESRRRAARRRQTRLRRSPGERLLLITRFWLRVVAKVRIIERPDFVAHERSALFSGVSARST